MAKTNERVNGIFDEWNVPDDYARISEAHACGTIKGDVRVKTKDVHSTAYFTSNTKKHIGLEVTLVNERGEGIIYIPQTEIPELPELAAMRNSSVEYKSRTWSSAMEGTSVNSKLRFLDGELAGKIYEGEEFA
jgi:hypothetical protein